MNFSMTVQVGVIDTTKCHFEFGLYPEDLADIEQSEFAVTGKITRPSTDEITQNSVI
jgi:hypothetical protein